MTSICQNRCQKNQTGMRIRVLSRAEVEDGGTEGASGIISIRSPTRSADGNLAVALAQATQGESARLLKLSFDDIGMERYGQFVGPTMGHIAEAIEFGRQVIDGRGFFDGPNDEPPLIAVHCEHGKSPSGAIALALLADHLGEGREYDAVNMLLRDDTENRMQPNPLAVSLADACLLRYGRIDAALAELCPRYVKWQTLWRDRAQDPDAYRISTKRRNW